MTIPAGKAFGFGSHTTLTGKRQITMVSDAGSDALALEHPFNPINWT